MCHDSDVDRRKKILKKNLVMIIKNKNFLSFSLLYFFQNMFSYILIFFVKLLFFSVSIETLFFFSSRKYSSKLIGW